MRTMDSKHIGEVGMASGMALVAMAFFVLGDFTQMANPLDPGPALFPRMISTLLFIMSVVQLVVICRKPAVAPKAAEGEAPQGENAVVKYVIGSLILTAIYIFLFTTITYIITTPLFLLGLLYLLGIRKWKVLLLVPIGYTVISYYLYGTVLMVPLP